jgi:hypothetical protein
MAMRMLKKRRGEDAWEQGSLLGVRTASAVRVDVTYCSCSEGKSHGPSEEVTPPTS